MTIKIALNIEKRSILIPLLSIFMTCAIFSPRDSAPPLAAVRSDPFDFAAIMNNTGYQFTKLQYEDLFSEDLLYSDINSGNFNKNPLIQKLQWIPRQNPEIQVQWTAGTTTPKPNDTFYLNGLTYKITNITDLSNDSGSSDFVVVRENADWHILLWRDSPVKQGKSFFSPP